MEIAVIKIGNSKGIRLSKTLLEKYNITDTVEVILEDQQIVLKPIIKVRQNWDQAFQEMAAAGDDHLEIPAIFEDENLPEWR